MKKLAMKEEDFKAEYKKFKEGDFQSALELANRASTVHGGYQHYTSLSTLRKIVGDKSMWLSRLDSSSLNDSHESGKYGQGRDWRRMYVGCFSYGRSENAFLWKMYCKQNRDAVRILISQEGMKSLKRYLQRVLKVDAHLILESGDLSLPSSRRVTIAKGGAVDVLYAAVKNRESKDERCNDLMWNSCHLHVSDLEHVITGTAMEGFFKDYEWRAEQETRIFVKTRSASSSARKIVIRLPDKVLNSMSIVLSPWASAKYCEKTEKELKELFAKKGLRVPRIRRSYLTGALDSW